MREIFSRTIAQKESSRKIKRKRLLTTKTHYHKSYLAYPYNKVRTLDITKSAEDHNESLFRGISIAEIEHYVLHFFKVKCEFVPHFYLKNLKKKTYTTKYWSFTDVVKMPNIAHPYSKRRLRNCHISILWFTRWWNVFASVANIIRKEMLQHPNNTEKKKREVTRETFSRNSEEFSIPMLVMRFSKIELDGSDGSSLLQNTRWRVLTI